MTVIYLAHPCGAKTKAEHLANLARAKRWYRWAIRMGYVVIADWILDCEIGDDFDAIFREAGLARDDVMILLADEYWMVGGEVTPGMERGSVTAVKGDILVRDQTYLGREPPEA